MPSPSSSSAHPKSSSVPSWAMEGLEVLGREVSASLPSTLNPFLSIASADDDEVRLHRSSALLMIFMRSP